MPAASYPRWTTGCSQPRSHRSTARSTTSAEVLVLGSTSLDTAMTDVSRDPDGRWRTKLVLGERYAELWGDETMRWVQIFTGGPTVTGPSPLNR